MSLGIIELSDAGIQVAIDNELVKTSPGFAVLDGGNLLVGEEAMQNARLLPRWTNNRFWNQLNTDPIANSTHEVRHHADIAFAHLESIWLPFKNDVDQVIVLVPAFYNQPQLGLLLGMAKECGIPVAGVADSSLLGASEQTIRPLTLHLDAHLHRITLTQLNEANSLTRKNVVTIAETGLFTLWDRWANIIADQFIQTSRFDPMHEANSEQALFNQLPEWIKNLRGRRSNPFELDLGAINHKVSISSDQLLAACTQIYPKIVQAIRSEVPAGESASLLLSHRFNGFPGLMDSLSLIQNIEIIELAEEQIINSTYALSDKIIPANGAISHVVSLPRSVSTKKQQTVKSLDSQRPTHLLVGDHAVAIGRSYPLSRYGFSTSPSVKPDEPVCTLFTRGDNLYVDVHVADAFLINGKPPQDNNPVYTGDTISLDDTTVRFISVT